MGLPLAAKWAGVSEATAQTWLRSRRYRGSGDDWGPTRSAGVTPVVLYLVDGLADGKLPPAPPEDMTLERVRALMEVLGVTGPTLQKELRVSYSTIYGRCATPVRLYGAVYLLGIGYPVNPLFRTDWILT